MIEEMRFRTDNSDLLTLVRNEDLVQIELGEGENAGELKSFTFQASDPHDMECLTRFLQTASRFRDEAARDAALAARDASS